MLAAPVQQPAVGGMGNGLGHHPGVHDDLLHAGLLDHATTPGSVDAGGQQRFNAFCVFRPIVTGRSGIVTADFGIVTEWSGAVIGDG